MGLGVLRGVWGGGCYIPGNAVWVYQRDQRLVCSFLFVLCSFLLGGKLPRLVHRVTPLGGGWWVVGGGGYIPGNAVWAYQRDQRLVCSFFFLVCSLFFFVCFAICFLDHDLWVGVVVLFGTTIVSGLYWNGVGQRFTWGLGTWFLYSSFATTTRGFGFLLAFKTSGATRVFGGTRGKGVRRDYRVVDLFGGR